MDKRGKSSALPVQLARLVCQLVTRCRTAHTSVSLILRHFSLEAKEIIIHFLARDDNR